MLSKINSEVIHISQQTLQFNLFKEDPTVLNWNFNIACSACEHNMWNYCNSKSDVIYSDS